MPSKIFDGDSNDVKKPFCETYIYMHKRCIDVPGYVSLSQGLARFRTIALTDMASNIQNSKIHEPILL